MHPDWNPENYSDYRYDADLALIIAGKDIGESFHISPVCLPDLEILKGTVVGWGATSDEKRQSEDIPRQAEVEKVSQGDFFLEDPDLAMFSSKRTFCVKSVVEGASPCNGDSGDI